nr:unnamed protein product [Callosobruchus analis]
MPEPQYTEKFREVWLKDPVLKEWLVAVENTRGKEAKCKFYCCIITSRYADLKSHALTNRHKTNAALFLGRSAGGQVQQKIEFASIQTTENRVKPSELQLALFIEIHTSMKMHPKVLTSSPSFCKCTRQN